MLVHYLDYIRSLNADLKRRGLYMFDVDEENLFKRAGDLESLFYMNEKFKECGGTNFVPSIYTETPMSYLSYSIYRDYIDDWYEELNSLMAQPENAGEIEISPDSQNKFLALLNLETGESGLEDEDSAIIDSTDNSIADGQEQGFSISNFVDNLFSAQSSQPSGVLYVGDEDDSAYGDEDSEFAVEDSEFGDSDSDDFDGDEFDDSDSDSDSVDYDEDEFLEPDDEFEEDSDDFDGDSDSAEDEFLEPDDEEDYEELDEEDSDEYLEEDDSEDSDEIKEVIMDVDEDIFDNDFGFEDFLGDYDETMKLYHVLLGVEGYLNEEPFFMEDEFENDTEVGYLHDDSYESGGIDVLDLFPDDGLEEDYFDEEDSDELEDDYLEEDDELEEDYFEEDDDFSDEDELEDDYLEEDDELFDEEGEESDEDELEDDYLEEDDELFDEDDEEELEDDYLEEDDEPFDEDEDELEDDYLEEDDELFDEDEDSDDGLEEDDDFFADEDEEEYDFGGNEGFDDLGEDMSLDDWMGTETSETTQGSSQVSEIPAKKEYRPHETVVKADKLVSGANRLFNLGARKYDKMKSKMYGTEDK